MNYYTKNQDTFQLRALYPSRALMASLCDDIDGSGIDAEWSTKETRSSWRISNGYHVMNAAGMYAGWQEFTVIFPKGEHAIGFRLVFHAPSHLGRYYDLRPYLEDLFTSFLHDYDDAGEYRCAPFSALPVGATFDFVSPYEEINTFSPLCTKISAMQYTYRFKGRSEWGERYTCKVGSKSIIVWHATRPTAQRLHVL